MTAALFADDTATADVVPPASKFNDLIQADRDALVTANIGLARTIAQQAAAMDRYADADDLFGECLLAFVESARLWQPANGTPFGGFAAGYARRRLSGRVLDAHRRQGGARTVRGLDMGQLAGRAAAGDTDPTTDPARTPDAYDRELLRLLSPAAREIVEAVVFEGCSPAVAAARSDRAVKDVLLICRNAAEKLGVEQKRLDEPDLTDFIEPTYEGE